MRTTPTTSGKKSKVLDDGSNALRSGEKRKRQDDQDSTPDPSSEGQKHPRGLDFSQKPHTPIRPPLRSPLVSQNSSAHESQLSTPKRETAYSLQSHGYDENNTPVRIQTTGILGLRDKALALSAASRLIVMKDHVQCVVSSLSENLRC